MAVASVWPVARAAAWQVLPGGLLAPLDRGAFLSLLRRSIAVARVEFALWRPLVRRGDGLAVVVGLKGVCGRMGVPVVAAPLVVRPARPWRLVT